MRYTLDKFKKRTYRSFRQFWGDVSFLVKNLNNIVSIMNGKNIKPAFRERLILATTMVNDCRYCAYFHTNLPLRANIKDIEIDKLLSGILAASPPDEVPALLYAQHWAETSANQDPQITQNLKNNYGDAGANAIELVLRVAMTGNLAGNTWDYFLYRLSFGHWGA